MESEKITDNKLHFKTKLDNFDKYAHAAEAMPLQTKFPLSLGKVYEFEINGIGQKDIILDSKTPPKKRGGVEW